MHIRRILAAFFVLFIALCAVGSGHASAQTTIHVPADQPTIQAGINAANNGDTVLVAPGTYYENIGFKGKAITVTSSAGPATTIIDGGGKDGIATVTFSNGETSASVISNFTIRDGGNTIFSGAGDGGVYVSGASPTIQGNTITANYCHNIDVEGATPTILNNEISGVLQRNTGTNYCSFRSGINLEGTLNSTSAGPTVIGNTIENNLTGSGINLWAAQNVLILNNIIRNNISPDPGSAFLSANSEGTILAQNLIYKNTSTCGGAIAPEDGGFASNPTILIANNTIVDNITTAAVGDSECIFIAQIYPDPYSYGYSAPGLVVVNNIISGSTNYPAVNCSWFSSPSEATQPTFQNNILYNAGGPFFGSYCVDVSGKYNNIVADPQFVSPSTGDYHLKSTSPAIDAGLNSALQTFLSMAGTTLAADFDGNPRIQNATGKGCIVDMGAYEATGTQSVCSTTVTLQSSLNPSIYGQSVAFTATVTSVATPTGSVTFSDGTAVLATPPLISTGSNSATATFTTSSLTLGSHPISAVYVPSGTSPSSSASLTQTVLGVPTAATVASSLNPAPYGQSVTFTATVTSTSTTSGAPTGSITFSDGATVLATQPLSSTGSITAAVSFSTSSLTVGTHVITGTYTPSGNFAGSTAMLSQSITGLPTTTTLSSSLNPSNVAQSVIFTATIASTTSPTGSITFSDGATVLGTQPLAVAGSTTAAATFSTAALAAGTHTITATYVPLGGFAASSAQLTQTVNAFPSATTLTAAPNPALFGTAVTLTAAVTGTSGTPTGNITFYDGASVLAIITLDAFGHAAFTTSTLAVGSHSLTIAYAGSSTYAAGASPPVIEVIQPLPQDFTITLASPTITIRTQHHATTTLTLASINGFADSLAITCANLPQYVTCQPAPSTATLAVNSTSTVSLYLDTDSVLGYARNTPAAPPGRRASPIALALLFPFGFLASLVFSRTPRRAAASLRLLALLLALLPLSLALAGCGEIILASDPPPSAAPGTYTIPITAIGATTHISHTVNLNLTVTP